MASSPCGNSNFDSGLEIKTRSVEQTLIPLVSQVSTSYTHKQVVMFLFARQLHFKKPLWLHNNSRVGTHEANFASRVVYLILHATCFLLVLHFKSVSRAGDFTLGCYTVTIHIVFANKG